jgi:uncharacterized membrane protein
MIVFLLISFVIANSVCIFFTGNLLKEALYPKEGLFNSIVYYFLGENPPS